jgi:hypothetical protein
LVSSAWAAGASSSAASNQDIFIFIPWISAARRRA